MSAIYKCDICKKKVSKHQNEFFGYCFLDNDNRKIEVYIDFNQWKEMDMCDECAKRGIIKGIKKLAKTHWKMKI